MRKKDINGIVNDLLDLRSWENPLNFLYVNPIIEFNLLSGSCSQDEDDSFTELLEEKRKWFLDRVASLNGSVGDFQEAKIIIKARQEIVELTYRGDVFMKKKVFWKFCS